MSGTILDLATLQAEFPDNTSQLITPAFGRNGWASVSAMFLRRRALVGGNYNAVLTDWATTIKINSATAGTVTIASGIFLANMVIGVLQEGVGTVTLLPSGTTFVPTGLGPSTRAQGSAIYAVADPDVANQFWVFGDVV
jgi:hypothetical protein